MVMEGSGPGGFPWSPWFAGPGAVAGVAGGGHADAVGLVAGLANPRAVRATSFAVRLCASAFAFERTVGQASRLYMASAQPPW